MRIIHRSDLENPSTGVFFVYVGSYTLPEDDGEIAFAADVFKIRRLDPDVTKSFRLARSSPDRQLVFRFDRVELLVENNNFVERRVEGIDEARSMETESSDFRVELVNNDAGDQVPDNDLSVFEQSDHFLVFGLDVVDIFRSKFLVRILKELVGVLDGVHCSNSGLARGNEVEVSGVRI